MCPQDLVKNRFAHLSFNIFCYTFYYCELCIFVLFLVLRLFLLCSILALFQCKIFIFYLTFYRLWRKRQLLKASNAATQRNYCVKLESWTFVSILLLLSVKYFLYCIKNVMLLFLNFEVCAKIWIWTYYLFPIRLVYFIFNYDGLLIFTTLALSMVYY